MKISPYVRAVQVPDENPLHPQSTNIYIIGKGESLSVDSGEAFEKFRWMLRGYLAAIERTEIAIAGITHHHIDHSGNLKDLHEVFGAEVAVPDNGVDLLQDRLPSGGFRVLRDGQSINLDGGIRIQILSTPGHSIDSICFYIEEDGVLFTGDTLLGVGTTTVNDLGDYRKSLERLVELPNLKMICPGHGPIVNDARERLQTYINHRNMREQQIIEVLTGSDPLTSWDIMMKIYGDIDKRLRSAADGNVRAHLGQLEKEGRLEVYAGKKRKRTSVVISKERKKLRERRKIIRQAKGYELDEHREALALQESPPMKQWSRFPTYGLKQEE